MTGSATLERDLEQLTAMLDAAPPPKCDYRGQMWAPERCEKQATHRIRLKCGHGWNTCAEHVHRTYQMDNPHICACGKTTPPGELTVTQL